MPQSRTPLPRRRSVRLQSYDYRQQGVYFITVCSHDRQPLFGSIVDGKMVSSAFGMTVSDCWTSIPAHFQGTILDEFVVMPNHVHGLIAIADLGAGEACLAPTVTPSGSGHTKLRQKRPTLGTIVGSFKAATTKRINDLRGTPGVAVWQRNYYEHIVRNDGDLEAIREYIIANPRNWSKDELNPATI